MRQSAPRGTCDPPSPLGETGNPPVVTDMAPGVVPAQQSPAPGSVKMPSAKKKTPIFIGVAVVIVAFVLNVVFFVMPVLKGTHVGDVVSLALMSRMAIS